MYYIIIHNIHFIIFIYLIYMHTYTYILHILCIPYILCYISYITFYIICKLVFVKSINLRFCWSCSVQKQSLSWIFSASCYKVCVILNNLFCSLWLEYLENPVRNFFIEIFFLQIGSPKTETGLLFRCLSDILAINFTREQLFSWTTLSGCSAYVYCFWLFWGSLVFISKSY